MEDKKNIIYCYSFLFKDGKSDKITLELDSETLSLINKEETVLTWAELTNRKCPNCTLNPKENIYCPIAKNLTQVIEMFKNSISSTNVKITITSDERTYVKQTSLQRGLSSLIGIIMATSGCPIMDKLKPLARYHLPLSSLDETRFRVTSMYLLAQYLRKEEGLEPDWELKGLDDLYSEIGILNKYFSKRVSSAITKDASVNAVIILNCFTKFFSPSLTTDLLTNLHKSFHMYMQD